MRAVIGHERTRARKAVAALAGSDSGDVAKLLGMRKHTIAAILSRRMLPGRTFADRASKLSLRPLSAFAEMQ
jgi:hypothetical protein